MIILFTDMTDLAKLWFIITWRSRDGWKTSVFLHEVYSAFKPIYWILFSSPFTDESFISERFF